MNLNGMAFTNLKGDVFKCWRCVFAELTKLLEWNSNREGLDSYCSTIMLNDTLLFIHSATQAFLTAVHKVITVCLKVKNMNIGSLEKDQSYMQLVETLTDYIHRQSP